MAFASAYAQRKGLTPLINTPPATTTALIAVIPCYNEPDIIYTLESLLACEKPPCKSEILVVINHAENSSAEIKKQNNQTYQQLIKWSKEFSNNDIFFHILYFPDINKQFAGAGYARRLGMDEAALRFSQIDKPKGIILSMDADTLYSKNYLLQIFQHYQQHPETNGTSNHFEHLYNDQTDKAQLFAVMRYELHLRYYIEGLRLTGFPAAFHTIGSAFTVTANAYCKAGGMNIRKAGEDFYFMYKIFKQGNFFELNNVTAFPSSRCSNRVPFGTGKAVEQHLKNDFMTYHPGGFTRLKTVFDEIPSMYNKELFLSRIDHATANFMQQQNAIEKIAEIRANTASAKAFKKRFFAWFDGLMIIHYLNDLHRNTLNKIKIEDASLELLMRLKKNITGTPDTLYLLKLYRDIQSASKYRL